MMKQQELIFDKVESTKEASDTVNKIKEALVNYVNMSLDDKVFILNEVKLFLHEVSPFKQEPVDYVKWVKVEDVVANDYNPNSVAPPEMELLRHSINHDGYTQPE